MRRICILIFLSLPFLAIAQDYSYIRKTIKFSAELEKASTCKSITEALADPASIISLKFAVLHDTIAFQKFTATIPKFKNLRKIIVENFYDHHLVLPESFWGLQKLEYISVHNLTIESFHGMDSLQDLKYLSLMGSRLKIIPEEVYALAALEYLDLNLNQLDTISSKIKTLKKLRELDLSNNCFTNIPIAVTMLSSLEYLDFDNPETAGAFADGTPFCVNRMSSFPDISKMTSLKNIHTYKLIVTDETVRQKLEGNSKFKGATN
jgi:Leucine-rich repeat (LRR) protein